MYIKRRTQYFLTSITSACVKSNTTYMIQRADSRFDARINFIYILLNGFTKVSRAGVRVCARETRSRKMCKYNACTHTKYLDDKLRRVVVPPRVDAWEVGSSSEKEARNGLLNTQALSGDLQCRQKDIVSIYFAHKITHVMFVTPQQHRRSENNISSGYSRGYPPDIAIHIREIFSRRRVLCVKRSCSIARIGLSVILIRILRDCQT